MSHISPLTARRTVGVATMHRADMMGVLYNSLPPSCELHTSKRLARYTELPPAPGAAAGTVRLHFTDGSTADADVLVGADGIKSATRGAMYDLAHGRDCDCAPDCDRMGCPRCRAATPHWSGTVTYRYLIPTERLREKNPEHQALTRTMSVRAFCSNTRHTRLSRVASSCSTAALRR